MKFQLEIPDFTPDFSLKHGDGMVLLGSCFSDTMLPHFRSHGFRGFSNPFGTIFHPIAIGEMLLDVLEPQAEARTVQRGDLWFDWRCSGHVFGHSEEELETKVQIEIARCLQEVRNARLLVVTFGTAWGYRHRGKLVANCHKMPQTEFEKELSEVEDMAEPWESLLPRLHDLNPDLNVVFTVSPVRHIKDGLVENNRSKARLIELSHQLAAEYGCYFPSYEIVTDVLRDHRFFKEDLVHLNAQAVRVVWEHFASGLFDAETLELSQRVHQLNQMKEHQTLYPGSKEDQKLKRKITALEDEISRTNPEVYFQ